MTARRLFSGAERQALYLASGGLCARCGTKLSRGFHADHTTPFANGGPTDVTNGQALCPTCNLKKGIRMNELRPWGMELRTWQEEVFRTYREKEGQDFLLVATPGAGKTTAALRISHWLLSQGVIQRIVIVTPSSHLRGQWAEAAHAVGISLDPEWENQNGRETGDFHGVAVTYQSITSSPMLHRKHCADRPTLVVFDEIHHAGRDLGWGESLLTAFSPAARRLAMSGTPFRSDSNRIPFVRYEGRVSVPDHSFGYQDALRHGVIRPILFPHYEGEMEWLDNGEQRVATFADDLDEQGESKRLRTALMPSGDWLRNVIREANDKLHDVRHNGHPEAGGLILAMDQGHARRVADLMRDLATQPGPAAGQLRDPLVVTSDDTGASAKIAGFRDGTAPWVIAVRMISEGVDIRRLRVGVYASNVVTELFFRQVVGRFVRWLPGLKEQTAYLYIPADKRLVEFARQVQQERDHFVDEASDDECSTRQSEEREGGLAPAGFFMPVGASEAVPKGVIHGSTVLSQEEIGEAKSMLTEAVGILPEQILVAIYRRLKERLTSTPGAPRASGGAEPPREQMTYRARDVARGVRNERAKSFASFILKTGARAGCGFGDLMQAINRKLAEHSGAYTEQLTVAQLREQQQLLARWATELAEARCAGRASIWLTRWEEDLL